MLSIPGISLRPSTSEPNLQSLTISSKAIRAPKLAKKGTQKDRRQRKPFIELAGDSSCTSSTEALAFVGSSPSSVYNKPGISYSRQTYQNSLDTNPSSGSEGDSGGKSAEDGRADLFLSSELIAKLRRYSATCKSPASIRNTSSTPSNMRILSESATVRAPNAASQNANNAQASNLSDIPEEILLANRRGTLASSIPSTAQYSVPIDLPETEAEEEDSAFSSYQRLPPIEPLLGFKSFVGFCGQDQILCGSCGDRFFCHINIGGESLDEFTYVDMRAPISAMLVAHNYRWFVVCIDHKQGSTIVVKDTSTFETIACYAVKILASKLCISMNSQILLLFQALPGGQSAALATYATVEGSFLAETKLVNSTASKRWEVSLCPADEDIICLLLDDKVNLMRSTANQIVVFSTYKIYDVTCNAWADDVTQAFGTSDGKIIMYRETVPMETVELKELHEKLIASESNDTSTAGVVQMFSSELGMLVCVQAGVIFLFPPPANVSKGNVPIMAEDRGSRWKKSKAIVTHSILKLSFDFGVQVISVNSLCNCTHLHLNETGTQILYADSESVWTCNITYAETVCKDGMRLVLARHSTAVTHIAVDCTSNCVASADKSGLILVNSSQSSKILSYGQISKLVSLAILPGGLKIIVASRTQVSVYGVLYGKLAKMSVIMEGDDIQAMTADPSNMFTALIKDSVLLVLRNENLEITSEAPMGFKQDILALKWSLNSVYIGILTSKDTVCLVEAKSGSFLHNFASSNSWNCVSLGTLLWTLEFKLRFFADISVSLNGSIYAMGNKFMMSRVHNGKEMETVNVHHEAVNFKESSTVLISTNKLHFVGTTTGGMIRVDGDNMERSTFLNCRQSASITTITHNKSTDKLYVGFEDGQVVCFNIIGENANEKSMLSITQSVLEDENCYFSQDFVLCPVDELVRYKTILKELNAERNMIRGQSEHMLAEYRERKERELKELTAELEETNRKMMEKMKRAEQKYEAIEATKEETFAKMKQEMNAQVEEQKAYYEKLISDQIKASLEKDEKQTQLSDDLSVQFEAKMVEMNKTFKQQESKWKKHVMKLERHLQELSEILQDKENQLQRAEEEKRNMEETHAHALEEANQNHVENQKDQIDASKQLKAHILRLKDENQHIHEQLDDLREKFSAASDELVECKFQLQEHKTNLSNRSHAQRRLREIDSMVTEMGEKMYDRRRLEQHVLGLLAFFNSSRPQLGPPGPSSEKNQTTGHTPTAAMSISNWATPTNLHAQMPNLSPRSRDAKKGLGRLAHKNRHRSK
ncbi:hypothetical protein Ddc_12541 [Ditylenchus destructor]|nr:hypothetical protein Ddc_12541 [Ditylenchus destructor]